MRYEDFVCFLRTGVQKELGEEVETEVQKITKNNSVTLDGLSIRESGSPIAPTIYLNDFYREYEDGMSLPEIIEKIAEMYRKNRISTPVDTAFFSDYELVKPRLACRLISREKNRELLTKVPHRLFLDLAVVTYCRFEDEVLGKGTILVREEHRKKWGVSEEELFNTARENTDKYLPGKIYAMSELLGTGVAEEALFENEEKMYVVSNQESCFGAAAIMYDAVLQEAAKKLGEDFWVLPSSIHECILVPLSIPMERDQLREMVSEINREEISPEEYLSDEVYLYQQELHRLSM